MRKNLFATGLRPVLIVVILFFVFLLTSCGGGGSSTTSTTTVTPAVSFDEQIRVVNPLVLNEDPDRNGITGKAVIDGTALEEGGYPTITVPVGQEEIKVSFSVTGHGFIWPGGVRETGAISDLYDTSSGTQVPLCTAKTSVGPLPDVSSRLDILREAQETIRVESLRQQNDREVEIAVTLKADPKVAQRIAGTNMGIQPIPEKQRVEIETQRNNDNSILGLVGGAILGLLTGNLFGAGAGVVEILCGDPTIVLHAKMIIKGTGEVTPPPPENQPPDAALTPTPDHGVAPLDVELDASASTDSDGTIVKYEWDYDGNGSWDFSSTDAVVSHSYAVGTWTPKVRVTDNDGATDVASSAVITVTNGGGEVDYTLFVAGTKGPLTDGMTWSVDETGSLVIDHVEIHGSDDSVKVLSSTDITFESALPDWCWVPSTGEIATVFWAQPDDPDVSDPGNIFINPGDYPIEFVVSYGGVEYHRTWTLRILDRPDFP